MIGTVARYHVTAWGWYWIVIIFAIAVPEIYWICVNSLNTVSDNAWALEQMGAHPLDMAAWTPAHWAISLVLWVLFGWLSVHIPFGLLR